VQGPKILNWEGELELPKKLISCGRRGASNDDIIHVNEHVYGDTTTAEDELGGVSSR
jgi:hypothetical protein